MTLKPNRSGADKGYPTAKEYHRPMRGMLACLAVAGTGMTVDHARAAELKKDVKKDDGKETKTTSEEAKKLVLEKIRKDVQENVKKLGVDDFRVRRDATKRLIAIGNVCEKTEATKKPSRNAKPVKPYRELVIEEMRKLAEHKDPEVKQRAKLVIKALTPQPVRIDRPPALGGVMMAPR